MDILIAFGIPGTIPPSKQGQISFLHKNMCYIAECQRMKAIWSKCNWPHVKRSSFISKIHDFTAAETADAPGEVGHTIQKLSQENRGTAEREKASLAFNWSLKDKWEYFNKPI